MTDPIRIYLESAPRKVFACSIEWPGWCRSGKDETVAIEALRAAAERYRAVTSVAGVAFPTGAATADVEIVERLEGGGGTAFGVPSLVAEADRHAVSQKEAARLGTLVEAAWTVFDGVVADAPAQLRKGPRGGGRDRDRIVEHVVGADHGYAREIGVKLPAPDPLDREAVARLRSAMLEVLCQPTDGSPLAGRRWTLPYAARRIAWHALDHAWEIEDRTES